MKKEKYSKKAAVSKIKPHDIYKRIREIIENSRGNIARAINNEMVTAYWNIGKEIT